MMFEATLSAPRSASGTCSGATRRWLLPAKAMIAAYSKTTACAAPFASHFSFSRAFLRHAPRKITCAVAEPVSACGMLQQCNRFTDNHNCIYSGVVVAAFPPPLRVLLAFCFWA
eukprot:scaffold178244_cov37-Tisochrysis_lutea.AAC.1